MWDVKLSNRSFESGNETMFYLNYVGCKGVGIKYVGRNQILSFTLTMWDVKEVYASVNSVFNTVLP